jgi:hypothetical protein
MARTTPALCSATTFCTEAPRSSSGSDERRSSALNTSRAWAAVGQRAAGSYSISLRAKAHSAGGQWGLVSRRTRGAISRCARSTAVWSSRSTG